MDMVVRWQEARDGLTSAWLLSLLWLFSFGSSWFDLYCVRWLKHKCQLKSREMDAINKLYLNAFEARLTFFTGCVISSDSDMCVGIYFLLMIGVHVQIKLLFSYISGSQSSELIRIVFLPLSYYLFVWILDLPSYINMIATAGPSARFQ